LGHIDKQSCVVVELGVYRVSNEAARVIIGCDDDSKPFPLSKLANATTGSAALWPYPICLFCFIAIVDEE